MTAGAADCETDDISIDTGTNGISQGGDGGGVKDPSGWTLSRRARLGLRGLRSGCWARCFVVFDKAFLEGAGSGTLAECVVGEK